MTQQEVAEWLRMSNQTIRALTRTGELPSTQIGEVTRYWLPALRQRLFPTAGGQMRREDEPEIVDVKELAELLDLSVQTVRAKAAEGVIPATRIGREWRFHWPTIRSRLEAGKPLADPPE